IPRRPAKPATCRATSTARFRRRAASGSPSACARSREETTMIKTSRWTRALAGLALMGAVSAGEDGLTEANENPNNPETVPVQTILLSGIWPLASNEAGRGVFGEWTTLYHVSTWAQHTAESTYNDEDNYVPREGIPDNIWDEMYAGALTDLRNVREIAREQGDESLEAVAEILLVY